MDAYNGVVEDDMESRRFCTPVVAGCVSLLTISIRIRIHIKVKSRIRTRNKVKKWIRIRIILLPISQPVKQKILQLFSRWGYSTSNGRPVQQHCATTGRPSKQIAATNPPVKQNVAMRPPLQHYAATCLPKKQNAATGRPLKQNNAGKRSKNAAFVSQ